MEHPQNGFVFVFTYILLIDNKRKKPQEDPESNGNRSSFGWHQIKANTL